MATDTMIPAAGPDSGDFDVLRARMAEQAAELARRAELLNERRVAAFGSNELRLLGGSRLVTGAESVLCDLVSVDGRVLAGANPGPGAGARNTVDERFAWFAPSVGDADPAFTAVPPTEGPDLFGGQTFLRDFGELFRYYRGARLLRLRRVDGLLLAVFRTGPRQDDVRVLRWRPDAGAGLAYADARGDRDHVFPPVHDVAWVEATREDHVPGRNPLVSVEGELFVSTAGGALTVRSVADTESNRGTIHREPVEEPLQSLADAEIAHARVGTLILMRVRPYKERAWRYLVYTTTTGTVVRLDGIGQGTCRLPGDEGIVFPGGFHLGTGAHKTFDTDTDGLRLERVVHSPNGEDTLYAFRHASAHRCMLLSYNAIRKQPATPIVGRAFTLLGDGRLVVLRGDDEPTRAHPVQVWATPYADHVAELPTVQGKLGRIGNADLVGGISEALSVVRLVEESGATAAAYEAVSAACARVADHYHWLAEPEAGSLAAPLNGLRETAGQLIAEFRAVQDLTQAARVAVDREAEHIAAVVRRTRAETSRGAATWIRRLTELRDAQGRLAPLRDMRHADLAHIDELHTGLDSELASAGRRAVAHLDDSEAFAEFCTAAAELAEQAREAGTVSETGRLTSRLDDLAGTLLLVADVAVDLDDADAAARTAVLEHVTEVQAALGRAGAILASRRRVLAEQEGRAESAAQLALLAQTVTAALGAARSPDSCDEQRARILLRIEDLDARFPELDDVRETLSAKRAEVEDVFAVRRQQLVDQRARQAARLMASGERVVDSARRRAAASRTLDEVNAYFASDPLIAKVRRTIAELRELGEEVDAEELEGRLHAARRQVTRTLRDRTELTDNGTAVRLGRHRFAVATQAAVLTLVPHDGGMAFALTGTDYRRPVGDPDFAATRPFWTHTLPSESPRVYRAEHLAGRLLAEHGAAALGEADLPSLVGQAAEASPDEGYERGVHDHDAGVILAALLRQHAAVGLLRYPPAERAAAQLLWAVEGGPRHRGNWEWRTRSLARARDAFGRPPAIEEIRAEIAAAIARFGERHCGFDDIDTDVAAEYLFEELALGHGRFVTANTARTLVDKFRHTVGGEAYDDDLRRPAPLASRRQLVEAWLGSYAAASGETCTPGDLAEAVVIELYPELPRYPGPGDTHETVTGLLGTHPRVHDGRLTLRVDEFLARTSDFRVNHAPAFRAYQARRQALVAAERARLRLDEHRPAVPGTFVRNRLIDDVYLPLIGDNLAKQIGAAGSSKGTDNHGLLLLISPPGYGKTTIVEYVAERLGLLLVKVDGPALGRGVASLDPAEAPNATARREVEKINFALEAGSNVMLYLDDIQHTSPELLQKFIPLCDAQRRIAGVRNGQAHTHDLRGKRFAVVMSGNPYTEEGRAFRVPDMLANRADVWNLGDVLTGKQDAFTLSFIENALASNPVLAPLADRGRADVDQLLGWAHRGEAARPDLLGHTYPPGELDRMTAVLCKLLAVRDTVLAVNRAYMHSAAQSDETRTEPPFRLQGSYRNMNRIAARVVPAMNGPEVDALVTDHYTAEAQTLAADAEANLLKLAEIRGLLTTDQAARWGAVKAAHLTRHRG